MWDGLTINIHGFRQRHGVRGMDISSVLKGNIECVWVSNMGTFGCSILVNCSY